jgi:hypothetical protein
MDKLLPCFLPQILVERLAADAEDAAATDGQIFFRNLLLTEVRLNLPDLHKPKAKRHVAGLANQQCLPIQSIRASWGI